MKINIFMPVLYVYSTIQIIIFLYNLFINVNLIILFYIIVTVTNLLV